MKFSGFVYHVEDYCCANFRYQQSFFDMFEIKLENCNFRKSLHFNMEKKRKKKEKKWLLLGAGIIQ